MLVHANMVRGTHLSFRRWFWFRFLAYLAGYACCAMGMMFGIAINPIASMSGSAMLMLGHAGQRTGQLACLGMPGVVPCRCTSHGNTAEDMLNSQLRA